MWEFLSSWSELYGNDEGGSLLSVMTNQLDAAATNMKRFAGDVAQVALITRGQTSSSQSLK